MIGYLLLLQVLVAVSDARPGFDDDMLNDLYYYDANLNPGFNLDAFRIDQLNLHNYYRKLHRVPKMKLDERLNKQAQDYAEKLAARAGKLEHCMRPKCNRHGAGENLARAWGAVNIETNATKAWYEEIWDFNYCHKENRKNMHRPGHEGKPIGHFTQVVWKNSIWLGIGYARTKDRTGVYVVGRYKAHGNVPRQYKKQVTKPSYIFRTLQNNCYRINGGYSRWSAPGKCTQTCGGGVRLQSRQCNSPKPSLNGKDCDGPDKKVAAAKWCNIESCPGKKTHRDMQCEARGFPADSHNFGGKSDCQLHCYQKANTYMLAGNVDDGTHCDKDSGVCVLGVCQPMPKYFAPTEAPPTDSSGAIIGSYTKTPSADVWENKIFVVPDGVTNVVVTNRDYNNVKLLVGYETSEGGVGYNWGEDDWMNGWVDYYGSYETDYTTAGVTYKYKRLPGYSTVSINGPVEPDTGYHLAFFVQGNTPAQISWKYGVTA